MLFFKIYEIILAIYLYIIISFMKKILIIIFFLWFSILTAFAATTLNRNNNKVECPSELDIDVIKYWTPDSTWPVPSIGSVSCNNYYYYSFEDYSKPYVDWWQTLCNSSKDRVIWWNQSTHTITCRKWYDTQRIVNTVSNDLTNLWWTNSRLKISWNVGTNWNWSNITANQAWNVKVINWSFNKALIKSMVISDSMKLIKSVNAINTDEFSVNSNIVDLTDFSSLNNHWWIILGSNRNIKLFKTNKVVTIWTNTYSSSSPIKVSGKKTIVIYWGDLYINSDMYYQWNDSILWIIVIKDKNWKWWNIFINPNVTNIIWSIFSQYSISSASVSDFTSSPQTIKYYNWSDITNYLRNQLFIYWSVFSENTIGGSISPYKCPYYVSNCNQEQAVRYDLNYLRNYFLSKDNRAWTSVQDNSYVNIPYNNWKKVWWITCDTSWTCTVWITVLSKLAAADDWYSVVIKYNPNLQTNPPPLFSSN